MELIQLIYFQKVAQLEHITKAAKELYISQPSLSQTIARLEADVGVPLFDRRGNNITLNEYGRAFLKRVDMLLVELSDMRAELQGMRDGDKGIINFAATVPEMVSDFIGDYLIAHPNLHIHQLHGTSEQILNMLRTQKVDFAISIIPIIGPNIQWRPIITERFGVIVSNRHPLAAKNKVHFEELKSERFILNSSVDHKTVIYDFCAKAGFVPNIFFEGSSPELIGRLISQNCGISLVSEDRYKAQFNWPGYMRYNNDTCYCPIEPECLRTTGIAMLENHYFTPATAHFFAYLVEKLQRYHQAGESVHM